MSWGRTKKIAIATVLSLLVTTFPSHYSFAEDDPCASSSVIEGTSGDDTINGTPGDDIICGLDGDDVINGAGGNDTIMAGDGDDRVVTLDGNDWVDGELGADVIDAGGGADTLIGNLGDDILWGEAGVDELLGMAGNDTLNGGAGSDSLDGGADKNYCVKDVQDVKALGCYYDNKAPTLRAISVAAANRSIDTSVSDQWVRVKMLITESGSGLLEFNLLFVDWSSKTHNSFGGSGSFKYAGWGPVSCDELNTLLKAKPDIAATQNSMSRWCIRSQSAAGYELDVLVIAPYRLAKGKYALAGIGLEDGALNDSQINGAKYNVSVTQTASVPTGLPVLKSFEFITANKIDTSSQDQRIVAQATYSVGPVGLGASSVVFHRAGESQVGRNPINFNDGGAVEAGRKCDLEKYTLETLKNGCVLSSDGNTVKVIYVANVAKNSEKGTYKFSTLIINGNSGKGRVFDLEALNEEAKYVPFLKLAVVQSGVSIPLVIDGTITFDSIRSTTSKIDTGAGEATIPTTVHIVRTGGASKWTVYGYVQAMFCPTGEIRRFPEIVNRKNSAESISAGIYCAMQRVNAAGNKYWWPHDSASNAISRAKFTIGPEYDEATVNLVIPSHFKKGKIIVALDQLTTDYAVPKYLGIQSNWTAMPFFTQAMTPSYKGVLFCGKYATCTEHYAVVVNGN